MSGLVLLMLVKVKEGHTPKERSRGVRRLLSPVVDKPLLSVTYAQCDARLRLPSQPKLVL